MIVSIQYSLHKKYIQTKMIVSDKTKINFNMIAWKTYKTNIYIGQNGNNITIS